MILQTLLALGFTLILSSCNVISWLDHPHSEDQYRSVLRACLDNGDFDCVAQQLDHLSQLDASAAATQSIWVDLNRMGYSPSFFVPVMLGNSIGTSLTSMIEQRHSQFFPTEADRKSILKELLQLYLRMSTITHNEDRGLARLLLATSIFVHILSEEVGADGVLRRSNLIDDPIGCGLNNTDSFSCFFKVACVKTTSSVAVHATTPVNLIASDLSSLHSFDGTPSLELLSSAASAVQFALHSELNVPADDFLSLSQGLAGLSLTAQGRCLRFGLTDFGIGRD